MLDYGGDHRHKPSVCKQNAIHHGHRKKRSYSLINRINHIGSFMYTIRTKANYVITFVDRSLFIYAYMSPREGGGLNCIKLQSTS